MIPRTLLLLIPFLLTPALSLAADEPQAVEPKAAKPAETSPWLTDFGAAKVQALREKKDLFIYFTGSDWVKFCKMLEEGAFASPEFLDRITKNYVLLYLDFPKGEEALSRVVDPAVSKELWDHYGVDKAPSIFLCDATGRPYGWTGYLPLSPDRIADRIDELRANGATIRALLANESEEKREELIVAAFPALVDSFLYGYRDYAEYLAAAEKIESVGAQAKRIRATKELEALLATPNPEWEKVHEVLTWAERLTGTKFLNACWGCATEYLAKKGDYEGAIALLRRMLPDPVVQMRKNGAALIESKIAEYEKAAAGEASKRDQR